VSVCAPSIEAAGRLTESFRDKVIRKCGESTEMKEKFFTKYAEPFEAMPRAVAGRFQKGGIASLFLPYSIHRIQEVHATVVHILWDLVHIALGAEDVT
jgi:hypothetical protein